MINMELIGRRLAQLRGELACPGEDTWTQGRLADETGLTRNMVLRLEKFGTGSLEACLTLLYFYHQRGYNISWILLPDNSTVSKIALNDGQKSIDSHAVYSKLTELKQAFGKEVDELISQLIS